MEFINFAVRMTPTAATSSAMPRATLRKGERLRHKTLIDPLFSQGSAEYSYPLRMQYRIQSREDAAKSFKTGLPPRVDALQMMITVPKRKMRHAVDRVLLRRRIREAYRLERLPLKESLAGKDLIISVSFVYISDKIKDYSKIRRAMVELLTKLGEEIAAFGAQKEGEI